MKIDEIKFGSITIDGKHFHQVIINDVAVPRDSAKLNELFGTTHKLGEWEVEALLRGGPKHIIIGSGFQGVLEVQPEVREKLEKSGAKVLILPSPAAVRHYNEMVQEGEKVNILIHTTC